MRNLRRRVVRGSVVVVTDEVVARDDLGGGERPRLDHRAVVRLEGLLRAGAAEVGVEVVDTGVDDGDVDVVAGEAGVVPGRRCADVLRGGRVLTLHDPG